MRRNHVAHFRMIALLAAPKWRHLIAVWMKCFKYEALELNGPKNCGIFSPDTRAPPFWINYHDDMAPFAVISSVPKNEFGQSSEEPNHGEDLRIAVDTHHYEWLTQQCTFLNITVQQLIASALERMDLPTLLFRLAFRVEMSLSSVLVAKSSRLRRCRQY